MQGIADAERHGLARTRGAFLAINVVEPLLYLGRWDEASDVTERALDLAPPSPTRAASHLERLARARPRRPRHRRQANVGQPGVVSGVRYEDQKHLPQAMLEIGLSLATDGPAAAVAVRPRRCSAVDVEASSPRYVWPLLVTAAAVARQAPGDDADSLLCKLRTLAEKQDAFGPVQRAWRLSYEALDPRSDGDTAGAADTAARLAAADAAVAAWEAIDQPYPTALALLGAAHVAMAGGPSGRAAAAARLRRAAPLAERTRRPPAVGSDRRPPVAGSGPGGRLEPAPIPIASASPAARSRCLAWSRPASRTARSRPRCSSRRRRPACTSPTSSPSFLRGPLGTFAEHRVLASRRRAARSRSANHGPAGSPVVDARSPLVGGRGRPAAAARDRRATARCARPSGSAAAAGRNARARE